jgi:DNA-binding beta-propeller fold protein YncE
MRMIQKFGKVLLTAFVAATITCAAQEKGSLNLVQTISIQGVQLKWDHFGVDLAGNRLFAASEEEPVVEVFDLHTNKLVHTIKGFGRPHNIIVFPEMKKLYVVDGEASEIKILDYDSYQQTGRIPLAIDADPYTYDASKKMLYVVNGGREAHTSYCSVSVVDVSTDKKLTDIKVNSNRLESMTLEKQGSRLFVNMAGNDEVGVIDRKKRDVVQTWPVSAGKVNSPMQLDESDHRLFVVTRQPARLVVIDTDTGKEVASVPVGQNVDDLSYDAKQRRLYVPAGEGFLSVVDQRDANTYQVIAKIPTKPGAKTGRLIPELNRYYLGVPARGGQEAQVWVYNVIP